MSNVRLQCPAERGILLVVDGVGRHAAGGKAAHVALSMIRNRLVVLTFRQTAAG